MSFIVSSPILKRVSDKQQRDVLFPSPVDGQQVFNERINLTETYDSNYGVWLSSNVRVMIRTTPAFLANRFVYVNGSFPAGGSDRPTVNYPDNNTTDNQTIGSIVEIGASIDVSRAFVSVAVAGEYFVEYGESIAVGEYVHAKTTGANSDQGFAAGSSSSTSGRVGIAFQNSGANPTFPNMILVNIGLVSETF
jgi:hypothetical protein